MEGLSPAHIIFVLGVVLIVVGPGMLPEAGSAVGKAIREFRTAVSGNDDPPPVCPLVGRSEAADEPEWG